MIFSMYREVACGNEASCALLLSSVKAQMDRVLRNTERLSCDSRVTEKVMQVVYDIACSFDGKAFSRSLSQSWVLDLVLLAILSTFSHFIAFF